MHAWLLLQVMDTGAPHAPPGHTDAFNTGHTPVGVGAPTSLMHSLLPLYTGTGVLRCPAHTRAGEAHPSHYTDSGNEYTHIHLLPAHTGNYTHTDRPSKRCAMGAAPSYTRVHRTVHTPLFSSHVYAGIACVCVHTPMHSSCPDPHMYTAWGSPSPLRPRSRSLLRPRAERPRASYRRAGSRRTGAPRSPGAAVSPAHPE